jgi:acyl dehydratase/NADP-dependent 3-hydroxy acid dehydrogenase YdfG
MLRTFEHSDQLAFAGLSGDANPLHVDELVARRTSFGHPLVHGVHLLLWAMDVAWAEDLLEQRGQRQQAGMLNFLAATFQRPVRVGQAVRCRTTRDGDRLGGELEVEGKVVLRFSAITAPGPPALPAPRSDMPPLACRDRNFDETTRASGELALGLDDAALQRLLPNVARKLPRVQAAEILAATRLVGMECPGRHSTFVGLELAGAPPPEGLAPAPSLGYAVEQVDRRFSLLRLTVKGPTLQGTLRVFYRSPPQPQATAGALARLVRPDELQDERVLVVGGSRGLGEVAVKLAAMAGADVVLTYHRGADDARRVVEEVRAAGRRCRAVAFDVTQDTADLAARLGEGWAPSQLHYFATPFIEVDDPRSFSAERFNRFCAYYVQGFLETVRALPGTPRGVLYPSTVFLDAEAPPPGAAEYCAAKAAGEILCRHLGRLMEGTRFHTPRLPRMRTDQTLGVVDAGAEVPDGVILAAIRDLPRSSS